MYKILQTHEFGKWYSRLDVTYKTLIDSRIRKVRESGELIKAKYLGDKLFEFKWKAGIRVYFTIKNNNIILLLIGGLKNGQRKDIQKAKELQKAYSL